MPNVDLTNEEEPMVTGATVPTRAGAAASALALVLASSLPARANGDEANTIAFDEALALGAETPSVLAL